MMNKESCMQPDWTRGTTETQISSLIWYLSLMTNSTQGLHKKWSFPLRISSLFVQCKVIFNFFQRYWWSMIPAVWLDKRYNWPNPTKSGSLRCSLFWWYFQAKNLRDRSILSRDIDNQKTLKYDCTRAHVTSHNQEQ